MTNPIFDMEDEVALGLSGEHGIIVGICEYAHAETQYLLRYVAADGRQVDVWWPESALIPYEQ